MTDISAPPTYEETPPADTSGSAGPDEIDRDGPRDPEQDASGLPPLPMGAGSMFGLVVLIVVLTWVGLARVQSQTRVLELGEEIKQLSDERTALLKRLRRIETERAYLRRPARVRAKASELLGMVPLDPGRRQRVTLHGQQVEPAAQVEPAEHGGGGEPGEEIAVP